MLIAKKKSYYPFISYNLFKKFFKKQNKLNKKIKIYKLSSVIFFFFRKKATTFLLYNGRKLVNFIFKKSKIFLLIGEFITTRVMNFGKVLHKRKKK